VMRPASSSTFRFLRRFSSDMRLLSYICHSTLGWVGFGGQTGAGAVALYYFLNCDVSDVRRVRQLRRTVVPHPDPLPTQGEGIKIAGNVIEIVARDPIE
jgi:hypothetical protein